MIFVRYKIIRDSYVQARSKIIETLTLKETKVGGEKLIVDWIGVEKRDKLSSSSENQALFTER